ncbi:hypothetical protein GCM10009661_60520 [Catellatospora chokoriensis]
MHTFGHGAHHQNHHAAKLHPPAAAAAVDGHTAAMPTADHRTCDGCGDHDPWQAFSICLAVLSALVALVLAVIWLRRQARHRLDRPRPRRGGHGLSRGPPPVPLRVRLAQLSVSRT